MDWRDKGDSSGMKTGLARRTVTHILEEKESGAEFLLYTFFGSRIPSSTIDHIINDLASFGVYATHTDTSDSRVEEPVISIYICWSEKAKADAESRGYVFRT